MSKEFAYYNENDEHSAETLRNLMKMGRIANGYVDTRSIEKVSASDLVGYSQCHFFAGIGVWSHALRESGWRDDMPIWTGSCPCQDHSSIGRRRGNGGERHLWPTWFNLIEACRPFVIVGEQVSNYLTIGPASGRRKKSVRVAHDQVDAHDGRAWIDVVCDDLEAAHYAVGAVAAPACGFGAPQKRERLYWFAEAGSVADPASDEERWARGRGARGAGAIGRRGATKQPEPVGGYWRGAKWVPCADGKVRPTRPGVRPLVDGSAPRMARRGAEEEDIAEILRGYGNALVAPQAIEFIRAILPRYAA
ncbi:DNA cytosine methyltransferase [Methylosinus sp. Ce-a6]|uniref:DNA cytosine methyltransferase n=1 Tax=Methylosinus sp. Ce-a6 TaxID=2172005 RepID=UPI0013584AEE|nr:DNA cytosine methyltransferase [Methylosinus sp. Ce-a6]